MNKPYWICGHGKKYQTSKDTDHTCVWCEVNKRVNELKAKNNILEILGDNTLEEHIKLFKEGKI